MPTLAPSPRPSLLLRVRTALDVPGLVTKVFRSKGGLWMPEHDTFLHPRNNALALLRRGGLAWLTPGANIITDAGDIYLAQLAAGEAPTNDFNTWEMCSAGTPGKAADRDDFTPIGGSQLAEDAGYPKTNDDDTDNTGATVDTRTTRRSYSAASFNHAAITHAIITVTAAGAGAALYTGFAWASSINKTAADTLKVIHNSLMTGV